MPLSSPGPRTFRIYALVDPLANEPRYVGQTAAELPARRQDHLRKLTAPTRKAAWLRTLQEQAVEPQIVLLEEFWGFRKRAYERESHWIKRLRSEGYDLLN